MFWTLAIRAYVAKRSTELSSHVHFRDSGRVPREMEKGSRFWRRLGKRKEEVEDNDSLVNRYP